MVWTIGGPGFLLAMGFELLYWFSSQPRLLILVWLMFWQLCLILNLSIGWWLDVLRHGLLICSLLFWGFLLLFLVSALEDSLLDLDLRKFDFLLLDLALYCCGIKMEKLMLSAICLAMRIRSWTLDLDVWWI